MARSARFGGRQVKKAWAASAPARAKAFQALARIAKKTPRALADAAWAGLVGIGALIWTRDVRASWNRMIAAWRRRRTKRAEKDPGQADTPDPQEVAATARRPHTDSRPTTPGGIMPGHHFVAPAMEMARIAANYDPKGMLQVGEDFVGLADALKLHAEAMRSTVEIADSRQPLDPQIVGIMRDIHGLQLKAASLAEELRPAFENLHNVDLERLRNPRKGAEAEAMWDVSANL
ncbi:hypothetical protein [Streptomyces sp. NPDC095613]|uniref:hypothetical protein n=1 Tax=Streptomyces sp. NPDC095613 TaxID=3155540 RepID=UPI0033181775